MRRIQRRRTKGWRMPENTKYVGRPTKWGNPIKLMGDIIYIQRRKTWVYYNVGDIDDVIYLYKKLWDGTKFQNQDLQYWADKFSKLDLKEIEGKNLACFCSIVNKKGGYTPCHADILLSLSNNITLKNVINKNNRFAELN